MSDETGAKSTLLVVDDDGDIRAALEMLLRYEGFDVWTARDGAEALARIESEEGNGKRPDLILTDLKMPNLDGLELLERIVEKDPPIPVVMISGHGDVSTAVDAMQRGAVNFLEKPLDEKRVVVTIRSALRERQLERENSGLRRQLTGRWKLIGKSPAMLELSRRIQQVAQSEAAVLVTGENGTGKEVVARNLHLWGPRAGGSFVTVNCAAIPNELIESELFGHEKGSFTGAHERRIGHFEAAHEGTLFLDEIGDMPLDAQAKVLRALETHEISRVGDSKTVPVDIRVIAATNADLAHAVEDKTFRMDLFYRLNVVPLRVPSLRERPEDINHLARHFLSTIAERGGRAPWELAQDAEELLRTIDYPGNVRQLKNLLEGATVYASGAEVTRADLEQILAAGPGLSSPERSSLGSNADPFGSPTFEEFKDSSEALFFRLKLAENEGNIKRTAERLGMQRSHLYKKLDRYDLRN